MPHLCPITPCAKDLVFCIRLNSLPDHYLPPSIQTHLRFTPSHERSPTMFWSKVFGVAALTVAVVAQEQYYIDPSSVPLTTRDVWCNDQKSTCPLLCTQYPGGSMTTAANDCDAETLTYDCVCGNGLSPNMTEYSLTIPFHICIEWGQQCVKGCNDVNTCQAACVEQHPCGALDPSRVNATATTSSSAPGATSTSSDPVVYDGAGDDSTASPDAKPNAAQAAPDMGRSYGLSIVFVGIFAAFGFIM
ncbi:hypothetical protein O988_08573 [Pseudogymnoascus sp. VKM F-3808]|nr:hypothetical protein O988_08573 [Pseudogymnoascus sp. VKM F-3808]